MRRGKPGGPVRSPMQRMRSSRRSRRLRLPWRDPPSSDRPEVSTRCGATLRTSSGPYDFLGITDRSSSRALEGLVDRWRALTLVCVAFFKREDRAVSEPPWRTELRAGASALSHARAPRAGCRADPRGRLGLRPDRHDGLLRALITSSTG